MGQVYALPPQTLILTPPDRLVASNAAGGMNPLASHVIALGENAGLNMGAVTGVIILGAESGKALTATANNTIVIGENSGNGMRSPGNIVLGAGSLNGPLTTVAAADLIVIGNRNFLTVTSQATTTYGFIGIGSDLVPVSAANKNLDGSILIGSEMFLTDTTNGTIRDSVLIGHGIRRNGTLLGVTSMGANVFIGSNILRDNYIGAPYSNSVMIGANIFANSAGGGFQAANAIFIGANINTQAASTAAIADYCTVVGDTAQFPNAASANRTFSVAFGYNNSIVGSYSMLFGPQNTGSRGTYCTIIGTANNFGTDSFVSSILLGNAHTTANTGGAFTSGNVAVIAPSPTAWILWGRGTTGNIVLGNSNAGQRDLDSVVGCTNGLKLCDGALGGFLPSAGGYFYVSAGALNWVESGGNNNDLRIGTGGIALRTRIPLTDGAAAAGGTLLNAPVVGNPTKWIPIDDSGTIRYIPAW